MADLDQDSFDGGEKFSPPIDESEYMMGDYYDSNVYSQSYANVLNLDDDRAMTDINGESPGIELTPFPGDGMDSEVTQSEEQKELSPGGVLDEETIAQGLSNLGRSADGTCQVFLHLTIPGFSLHDISLLEDYRHVQKLELPYNQLTDLSVLSNMPNLIELDASNNRLTKILDFKPPKNIKVVDLSYNDIEDMGDLSAHHYLYKLNLNNNHIKEMKGLEKCTRLSWLSMAHNNIDKIQCLDSLPIRHLNLRANALRKLDNLDSVRFLQNIDVSGNNIRSLKGLEKHEVLENINVEDNEVIDITEIGYIQNLPMLNMLNLLRNPIQELPDYRLSILYRIQRLTELDRHKVEVEEKVSAVNMFNPPSEVVAARDHIMHTVYSFLQPSKVLDSTLPSVETPYPMLVLVGPQGAGKKDLAMKLVEEFPDYFGYGISHTSRKPHPEELPGKDYHFISLDKFEAEIKQGKFLQTYEYHGNWYGLTLESIENVAREGLACIVHLELEGVLTLKNTYFEPRYVLIMPLDPVAHEKRLRDRGIYSEVQIEDMLKRAEMYIEHNQTHPGFFDMMIPSDDIAEAYKRVRRLVMDYLGICIPTPDTSRTENYEAISSRDSRFSDNNGTFTMGSANMGARTWSKPSIPDSVAQQFAPGKPVMVPGSPIVSGRGIVEEASLKRRQSAAKNAVHGRVPSVLDQILKPPGTAGTGTAQGLGDDTSLNRSTSAPGGSLKLNQDNMDTLPPASPDSSQASSRTSSSLSNISDQGYNGPGSEHGGSQENYTELPTDSMNPMELYSGSGSRPGSGSFRKGQPGTVDEIPRMNRPGSEKHKVLPPISPSPKPQDPEY